MKYVIILDDLKKERRGLVDIAKGMGEVKVIRSGRKRELQQELFPGAEEIPLKRGRPRKYLSRSRTYHRKLDPITTQDVMGYYLTDFQVEGITCYELKKEGTAVRSLLKQNGKEDILEKGKWSYDEDKMSLKIEWGKKEETYKIKGISSATLTVEDSEGTTLSWKKAG